MPSPLRCLADLPDQPPAWLWPGRIPRSALTLLVGDPGCGKSLLTLDMAARITAGLPWPDGAPAGDPGDVLLLSAEDSPARTVRSRLAALGADVRRVHYLNAGLWQGGTDAIPRKDLDRIEARTAFGYVPMRAFFALRQDAKNLQDAIALLPDCRLVVIDPIPAYLNAIDVDDPEQARAHLAPLATLADESGAAIVAVAHRDLPPGVRTRSREYAMRALVTMARSIHVVDRHPDDPRRRVFAAVKNNLAAPPPTLAFDILSNPQGDARIEWSPSAVELSAGEPRAGIAGPATDSPRRVAEIDRAMAWLQGALAAGPVPSHELGERAVDAGLSERCLDRARARLGVAPHDRKIGGRWLCALPVTTEQGRQITDMAALAVLASSPAANRSVAEPVAEVGNPNLDPTEYNPKSAA